jgi:hypothetical protein
MKAEDKCKKRTKERKFSYGGEGGWKSLGRGDFFEKEKLVWGGEEGGKAYREDREGRGKA